MPILKADRCDMETAARARHLLARPGFRRIPFYCAILILVFAVQLARSYGAPGGFIRDADGHPRLNDFAGVWTAGELVREGQPAAAYDWQAHHGKQLQLRGEERGEFYPWPYPPTFLAVAALLAALPFGVSMLVWLAATLSAYVAVLTRITGHFTGALVLLAMPITLLNSFPGQNGFLSAALLGGGLSLMRVRPFLGGILIGLLTYKPHLGLMVPVALIAACQWRAVAGATLSALSLVLVALALYGSGPWHGFVEQISRIGATVGTVDWSYKFQSVYGLGRSIGLASGPALALNAAAGLAVAGLLVHIWRRDTPYDLKAASLAVACTLASPYIFIYDLTLLCVALAFLLRYTLARGPDIAEAVGLVAVAGCFTLFSTTHTPAGLAASLLTGGLVARGIWPALLPAGARNSTATA